MLSSTHLKKIRSFIAFTLFASVFLHVEAKALTKVVFVDDKRNEVTMNIDHTGNVHMIDAPIPGDFYYKKSSEEFIFRLDGMQEFYRLPISKLRVERAKFAKVEANDRRITDMQVWDISKGKHMCGITKSSTSMVKDLKLTIGDMTAINNAFAHILGDDLTEHPCLNFTMSKAVADSVGFPVYLSTNHGTTLLKEEVFLEYGRRVLLPKGSILLDDSHLRNVYLHQIPDAAKKVFFTKKNGRNLKPVEKYNVSAIRQVLQKVRTGEWKPVVEEQKSFAEEMKEFSKAQEEAQKVQMDEEEDLEPYRYGGFGGLNDK